MHASCEWKDRVHVPPQTLCAAPDVTAHQSLQKTHSGYGAIRMPWQLPEQEAGKCCDGPSSDAQASSISDIVSYILCTIVLMTDAHAYLLYGSKHGLHS